VEVLDLNRLALRPRHHDDLLCVSALQHVVELEHLLDQVAGSLVEGGEFWSIGEYIGRNEGRLFPEGYEVANGYFTAGGVTASRSSAAATSSSPRLASTKLAPGYGKELPAQDTRTPSDDPEYAVLPGATAILA
jgi:hypothetical protein